MMSSLRWIDTHAHLSSEDFDVDRDEVLKRALNTCEYIIEIGAGSSEDASERAQRLADQNQNVYFTAGVHPHDAEDVADSSELKKRIESYFTHPKCVAVGECGLDYYYENSPIQRQKDVFKWQIELAEQSGLPLSIHTRDAEEDTRSALHSFNGKAVFHCFTGSQALASFGVEKGFFISFSGITTFKKAQNLRDVVQSTPIENILIETDAPYLAPVPMRGKRNESSFIVHTAQLIANLKQVEPNELAAQLRKNTFRLFSKLKDSSVDQT